MHWCTTCNWLLSVSSIAYIAIKHKSAWLRYIDVVLYLYILRIPDCKTLHPIVWEKLIVRETGIFRHNGAQLKAALNPSNKIELQWSEGFQVGLNRAPVMPRHASLSNSNTSDCCCFCSLDVRITTTAALKSPKYSTSSGACLWSQTNINNCRSSNFIRHVSNWSMIK